MDKEYLPEEPVAAGGIQLEEASLVAAPPGGSTRPAARNRQTALPGGNTTWKGRVVKNFKKFRKVQRDSSLLYGKKNSERYREILLCCTERKVGSVTRITVQRWQYIELSSAVVVGTGPTQQDA